MCTALNKLIFPLCTLQNMKPWNWKNRLKNLISKAIRKSFFHITAKMYVMWTNFRTLTKNNSKCNLHCARQESSRIPVFLLSIFYASTTNKKWLAGPSSLTRMKCNPPQLAKTYFSSYSRRVVRALMSKVTIMLLGAKFVLAKLLVRLIWVVFC